jgi:hypothetical protein
VLKGNQPLYSVERYVTIGNRRVLFGDGSHILYVNGQYRGDDEVGRLMHDFSCADPDEMNYEALAGRARYFKKEGGAGSMGSVVDVIREEGIEEGLARGRAENARETARAMLERGYADEEITDILKMDKAELDKIREEMMQMA